MEREQKFENLLQEIMMENLPNLVKELDTHSPETQSLKQKESKEAQSKTHHNLNAKWKTKRDS